MMGIFTKKERISNSNFSKLGDNSLIKALKLHFDTDNVCPADEAHPGEKSFAINDNQVVSVFNSIDDAKKFYTDVFTKYTVSNPIAAVSFFEEQLGKSEWLNYVSRQRLVKALTASIKKLHGGEIEDDIAAGIKSKPIEVLKSLFNLSKLSDKAEFYGFLLQNRDSDLIDDAVTSMLGSKNVDTKRIYLPDLDQHKTLVEFR